MQIYEAEKDSGQYKTPYLRKTALIGNTQSNLECFLPLENLSKLGGGNRQLLICVRLPIGYRLKAQLKAKLLWEPNEEELDEKEFEYDDLPGNQVSVVRLEGETPWRQKLIAAEKWATHKIKIPEFQKPKFGNIHLISSQNHLDKNARLHA